MNSPIDLDGPSYIILYEIMFCDYELDPSVRKRFIPSWLKNLRRMAEFPVPERCDLKLIVYLSRDKVEELRVFEKMRASLSPSDQKKLILVQYDHPAEGYGFAPGDHPDLWKNPNKTGPYRDRIFSRAIENIDFSPYDRIIRGSIDDDDFLLPWQFEQFVTAANIAFEEGKIVAAGLSNEVVAYVDKKTSDVVEFTHHMHGNKIYVASKADMSKLSVLSPWSIPERFDEENRRRMARAGVTLRTLRGGKPGYIYCRWGNNLSQYDKSSYYARKFDSIDYDSIDHLVAELDCRYGNASSPEVQQFDAIHLPEVEAPSEEASEGSVRFFYIPRDWCNSDEGFVAIFKDQSGTTLESKVVAPGIYYRLDLLPQVGSHTGPRFGFIQVRKQDGQRVELPGRGNLANADFVENFTLNDWFRPLESFNEGTQIRFSTSLRTLSWTHRKQTEKHISDLSSELAFLSAKDVQSKGPTLLDTALASAEQLPLFFVRFLTAARTAAQTIAATGSKDHLLREGVSRVLHNGCNVSVNFRPAPTKPLVVVLHGAKAKEVTLPYLPGEGLVSDLDVALLSISDPSFDVFPQLSISWWTGLRFSGHLT
ncbi:hypothetical protein [Corynebacterium mayonis]|uniref:hypothetical protein n=1 Tax=Corynebacterium mayonis TaxID=3062461 RepID=UPI0031400943